MRCVPENQFRMSLMNVVSLKRKPHRMTQRVITFETTDIIDVKSYKILVLVMRHNSSIAGQLLRASIMHSSSMAQQCTVMFLLCIMNYPELELPLFIKRLGKMNIKMSPAQGETGEILI